MNQPDPSSAEFFEAKYRADADPWKFSSSKYERQRYETVIRALSGRRYARAFEPGCSVGILTERLATICDDVVAADFSPAAAAAATRRCIHLPHVSIQCAPLTASAPWPQFDLVVLSEIGYYFAPAAWQNLVETMALAMRPGTVLLASHWLGHSGDHVQSGDAVHRALNHPLLQRTLNENHGDFRLERWTRSA
jgi:cyclopropane fatty-acyl-phospholipid synthase-like methyltransferase